MKKLTVILGVVVAVLGFMSLNAQADLVNVGDKFYVEAPLYTASGWDGGPFQFHDTTTTAVFDTFCASTSLYFQLGVTYTVTGFQSVGATQGNGTTSGDYAAAALYSNYMAGNITLPDLAHQEAFQEAIWYLIGDPSWTSVPTLAQDYVTQGLGYSWTSDGNVRQIVYIGCTDPGQPLLTLVPSSVPEPCTMLLLGSGLVGLVAFRKRFTEA